MYLYSSNKCLDSGSIYSNSRGINLESSIHILRFQQHTLRLLLNILRFSSIYCTQASTAYTQCILFQLNVARLQHQHHILRFQQHVLGHHIFRSSNMFLHSISIYSNSISIYSDSSIIYINSRQHILSFQQHILRLPAVYSQAPVVYTQTPAAYTQTPAA